MLGLEPGSLKCLSLHGRRTTNDQQLLVAILDLPPRFLGSQLLMNDIVSTLGRRPTTRRRAVESDISCHWCRLGESEGIGISGILIHSVRTFAFYKDPLAHSVALQYLELLGGSCRHIHRSFLTLHTEKRPLINERHGSRLSGQVHS